MKKVRKRRSHAFQPHYAPELLKNVNKKDRKGRREWHTILSYKIFIECDCISFAEIFYVNTATSVCTDLRSISVNLYILAVLLIHI